MKGILLVSLVVGSVLYRIVPYFGNEMLLPVPRMPRMFIEGSPGGIQKGYSKRLAKGLGVLWVVLPTTTKGVNDTDLHNLGLAMKIGWVQVLFLSISTGTFFLKKKKSMPIQPQKTCQFPLSQNR